jgi:hypothetical protein
MSLNSLPKELSNIIDTYEDEEKYKESIKNMNPKIRNKLILDELENIDLDEIIQFKLARQLANNYIESYNKKYKKQKLNVDIKSLTGIFLSLLEIYSYEELLNPTKIKNLKDDDYENLIIWSSLDDYINNLIFNIKILAEPNYYDEDSIFKFFHETTFKKFEDIHRKYSPHMEPSEVLRDAYEQILKQNPNIKKTTSWKKNIPLYEKYVLEELNKEIIKWEKYKKENERKENIKRNEEEIPKGRKKAEKQTY